MEATVSSVAERVERGAAWLDEHEPGWVDKIDVDHLSLGSSCCCVLGQLAASIGEGLEYGDLVQESWRDHRVDDLEGAVLWGNYWLTNDEARELGFEVSNAIIGARPSSFLHEYANLTTAWRDLIEARR